MFSKSANPLDLPQKSIIRALFRAKSVDPKTYSPPSLRVKSLFLTVANVLHVHGCLKDIHFNFDGVNPNISSDGLFELNGGEIQLSETSIFKKSKSIKLANGTVSPQLTISDIQNLDYLNISVKVNLLKESIQDKKEILKKTLHMGGANAVVNYHDFKCEEINKGWLLCSWGVSVKDSIKDSIKVSLINKTGNNILCDDLNIEHCGMRKCIQDTLKHTMVVVDYENKRQEKIEKYINQIKEEKNWLEKVRIKSKERGIPLDSMIYLDAVWMVDNE